MGTLTIRNVPDEQISILKQAAKTNNRSMEAEIRSHVEQWTAAWVAHKAMSSTNLSEELQTYLLGEQSHATDNDVSPAQRGKKEPDTQKEKERKPTTTAEIFAKAHRLLKDSGLTGDEQLAPPRSSEMRHIKLGS
ncbi:hypothetical protein [Bifidobacterium sp. ESL0732]|uniref:FitA-like ribbon-helix-helix domain-containing protein n=1 Tax=Bifidobacterium sp. ESL0732 TaxID=2983222 RepID=UPI0023F6D6C7|nr:hypothetical protein [Bifidobacterium sp. ESL0732]WEV63807.1 hypothetical protein OZX70_07705 [Bifidobacterium sp. ESL0732]